MVVTIPANLIYTQVKDNLPIQLYQVDGTLWNGSAQTLIAKNGDFRAHTISWKLRPLSLLLGKISIHTKFVTKGGYGDLIINRSLLGKTSLRNINIKIPIADLKPFLQTVPVDLQGVLDGQFDSIELSDNMKIAAADGTLSWNHAIINALSEIKIGDIILTLKPTDEGSEGIIESKDGGPLEINGILQLSADGSYDFKGDLKAKARAPRELKQALQFIGRPGPDGKITLNSSGTL